jgi:hypothetical protein
MYLRWIDVLAAGDDHVALAVDEIIEAVRIAAGEVADRTIGAAERLGGLVRQRPAAVESMGVAGEQFARRPVRDVVAVGVEQPDRRRDNAREQSDRRRDVGRFARRSA